MQETPYGASAVSPGFWTSFFLFLPSSPPPPLPPSSPSLFPLFPPFLLHSLLCFLLPSLFLPFFPSLLSLNRDNKLFQTIRDPLISFYFYLCVCASLCVCTYVFRYNTDNGVRILSESFQNLGAAGYRHLCATRHGLLYNLLYPMSLTI